jgi:hypothetical protein
MSSIINDEKPAKGSAQWFNERFEGHLFQLYSVAQHRLDRIEWELLKVVPQLLAALPLPEWVKNPDHDGGSAGSGNNDGDALPDMLPEGLVPLLERFARLNLTAARCKCIMEDLRPLFYDLRGDSVLDWTDAAVRADYGRRFMEWLQYDEWARDAWEHCRLTVDDLINDLFIFEEEEEKQPAPQ